MEEFQFLNPVNKAFPAERIDDPFQPVARLRKTALAGVYRFVPKKPKPNDPTRPEYFAVNFDRRESDLTPLTNEQRQTLSSNDRMKFVTDLPDLRQNMFADSSRVELWWLLLYLFLIGLAAEAWMTRRMVRPSGMTVNGCLQPRPKGRFPPRLAGSYPAGRDPLRTFRSRPI